MNSKIKEKKETTAAQERAWKENWAIYLLTGMRNTAIHFIKPVVSKATVDYLKDGVDYCIQEIKYNQQQRKRK